MVPNRAKHLTSIVLTVLMYLPLIFFPCLQNTKGKYVGIIPWKSISFVNFLIINFIEQCLSKRVFTWNEIFSFRSKWSIFVLVSDQFLVTVYKIQPEMKLIAGVISLQSFWQKWNSISGDKISSKQHPKWNHMKGNICTCVNKNDWLILNGPFISDHPGNEIHFISPRNEK